MLIKSNITGRVVEVNDNLGRLMIAKGKATAYPEQLDQKAKTAKPKAKAKTKN